MLTSVKSRIYLLAGLPLLVALLFILNTITEKYGLMHEMETLEPTTRLGIHIGAFIHETQKERGASAGWLGSGDERFKTALAQQRKLTNTKRSELKNYLKSFQMAGYGSEFSQALNAAIGEMNKIDGIRSKVDAQSITGKQAVDFYTHHNALMLEVVQFTAELATHAEIGQLRSAYVNFMQGKERAGIERAVMSNNFGADEFKEGAFIHFARLVTIQDTYISVFRSLATPEQTRFFVQQMSDPSVAEVDRMRKVAFSKIDNVNKAKLLSELHENMGFGGAIHQFKNYVLRSEPEYEQRFIERYERSIQILDELSARASAEEKAYIKLIRDTLTKYRKAAVTASEMIRSGYDSNEIDNAVKINDGPALKALHALGEYASLGKFGIDSKYWFDTITQKINQLKKVEDKLADDLGKRGSELYSEAQITLVTLSLIATVMICGVLVTVFFIGRGITDSLQHSVQFAQQIAGGDLTGHVEVVRRDEVGTMQQAMNDMRSKLVEMLSGISSAATQLSTSAEELATITTQTSTGIRNQQRETEQVATAMNEMTSTVVDVAHSASTAAEGAREANMAAQSGRQIVNDTISAVEQVACNVEHNANVVRKVNEDSEKIGVVLDVIRGIAEQTNLLALNAAIEAARAGEQGRGFAVVADEVRTLASRTQESTQEIQQVIEGLQNGAKEAVSAMDAGASNARAGAEKAAEAKSALETITTTVSSINDMNNQIASAAEEQSVVAKEIDSSIVKISQVAVETSNGAEQLAAASDDLASLSVELTGMIAKFKV